LPPLSGSLDIRPSAFYDAGQSISLKLQDIAKRTVFAEQLDGDRLLSFWMFGSDESH
jgi:hypothetical protein